VSVKFNRHSRQISVLFFLASAVSAQTLHTVSGTVLDASTNKPLPAATIRVAGPSNKGTITNEDGQFEISLPAGRTVLILSYLGYRSDTLTVSNTDSRPVRSLLQPEAIKMAEVVVTDEDPAIEIIRRAIASKPKWMGALKTFQCEAYSRMTIDIDTAIGAITESYVTLYWRANDSLREVVRQKRQTKNLAVGEVVDRIGQVTNFNDDTITTGGFKFIGPTSPNAFDYYDYKLLNTRSMDGMDVYDIRVIPRTRVRPLFQGTISIAERSYAVIGVDLEPNEAYSFPFIKDLAFHYRQQFRLYENRFWMPVDYRVAGSMTAGLAGLALLKFAFNRYVVMSDYTINPTFADSIARLPRLTVAPQASTFDSAYWAQHPLLPLNPDEELAYKRLDSTQTLEQQIESKAKGLTAIGTGLTGLSYADLRFNRVEGLFLGANVQLDSATNDMALRGAVGYGFSDKRWKESAGGTYYVAPRRAVGVGGDFYYTLGNRPDEDYYGDFQIFLGSLFAKDDYRDYFLSKGERIFVEGNFLWHDNTPDATMQLGVTSEQEYSLEKITEYSFFNRDRHYRENPPIVDGALRSVTFTAQYGSGAQYLFSNPYVTAHTSIEYSSKDITSSDFNFTRVYADIKAKFPTYNLDLIFNPTLSFNLAGGILTGDRLPQRLFNLESSYYGTAWFGSLRAARVKEFSGDRFVMLNLEHNFRRVPFLASGIPFLYKSNLELIVFGSVARSWMISPALADPSYFVPTGGWYYEGGVSVSRIFDLLRFDMTWRGTPPRSLALTLGIGDIF